MGGSLTKSPLERRNTVLRRSQRKSIHGIKPKVETIDKNIKKFRGTDSDDQQYIAIKNSIESAKADLTKRGRDLQPQIRGMYENLYKRLCEAQEALDKKLEENQEKEEKEREKADAKKESKEQNSGIVTNNNEVKDIGQETILEDPNEDDADNAQAGEARALGQSTEKRKTVELKFVEIIPDDIEPKPLKPIKSPEEKRKSILKMGVAVMPGAMMSEITRESSRMSKRYHKQTVEEVTVPVISRKEENQVDQINSIVENLQDLEYRINDFIGKKHGVQYNKIRDQLNQYLIELNSILPADDDISEQLKVSKNYVGSCLNFLDERATDDRRPSRSDDVDDYDEVFEKTKEVERKSNGNPLENELNARLQKLSKNTFV